MFNLSERIFERGFNQGFEQGFNQGFKQIQTCVIIKMYENGASMKQISELMDIPEEQIKSWVEKERNEKI